ncbi:MAG: HD domain-containing protein [Tissierellia bacterium]|nr:HD domain-containing protein [Tissierellia bacterium]
MIKDKLKRDIDFIIELDKMKSILRQNSLIDGSRKENDAEHSWHIAVMAMVLHEYSNLPIDLCKVIKMLLIHDLVEIYAGDTFCYDEEGNETKEERELKAADKLFNMLDEDKGKELRSLWAEFEERKTNEAIFAAAMDRLQPLFSNYYNEGGTWKKFNVNKEAVYKRIEPIKEASDEIWKLVTNMIEDAIRKGYIAN